MHMLLCTQGFGRLAPYVTLSDVSRLLLLARRDGGQIALSHELDGVLRLILVDDQAIVREGLVALIGQEADLEVVAQVTTVCDAERLNVEADVVVSGLALPDSARVDVIKRLRARFVDVPVLALTILADLAIVRDVLAAGANGYVLKSASTADLFAGIRAVARGELYLQPSIGLAFASAQPDDRVSGAVDGLTATETDVLRLLAFGHTNAEIAQLLSSSLRTIESHRAHIHRKLDCHTRAEITRFALEAGLLRLDGPHGRM